MVLVFRRDVYTFDEWTADLDVMDDVYWIADPPEFILPEWNRDVWPRWEDSHDWTMDYDYPYDYVDEDDDE